MTTTLVNLKWTLYFLGLSIIIIVVGYVVVHSSGFAANPDLFSFAVTADITCIIPLLYLEFNSQVQRLV